MRFLRNKTGQPLQQVCETGFIIYHNVSVSIPKKTAAREKTINPTTQVETKDSV
jgi:hypothetical protein